MFARVLFVALLATPAVYAESQVLRSAYVPQLGTLYLTVDGSAASFTQDGNSCRYTKFGVAAGCTRMSYRPKATKLEAIATEGDVTVYRLSGISNYRFVSDADGSAGSLLMMKMSGDQVTNVYPMKRVK